MRRIYSENYSLLRRVWRAFPHPTGRQALPVLAAQLARGGPLRRSIWNGLANALHGPGCPVSLCCALRRKAYEQ